MLNEKELLVTIRTVAEGGEENGFRFDYFETIRKILEQQTADYVMMLRLCGMKKR